MAIRTCLQTGLFTLVALLSFAIWAWGGRWFDSEVSLYSACALVFLSLGGMALLPGSSIAGPKRCFGFCIAFAIGFIAFAIIWTAGWFTFRNTTGEVFGSFLGILALVAILKAGKLATPLLYGTAVVFLWHTLGYYLGEFAYESLQGKGRFGIDLSTTPRDTAVTMARLSWGACYGAGFGLGLSQAVQASRHT